jgi:hypothetical protein
MVSFYRNFWLIVNTCLDTGQSFKGNAKFNYVYDVRNQISLCKFALHHVLTHGLKSLVALTTQSRPW